MRNFIVRGAMVVAFAIMGLAGSAASVSMEAVGGSGVTNSTIARMPVNPDGCDRYIFGICEVPEGHNGWS